MTRKKSSELPKLGTFEEEQYKITRAVKPKRFQPRHGKCEVRQCLNCDRDFPSRGIDNRLCKQCATLDSYRAASHFLLFHS
jgi:hypothetical protein